MGLKLDLLSLWMPDFIMKKEIKTIAEVTIRELDRLMEENSHSQNSHSTLKSLPTPKIEGRSRNRRIEMASAHEQRVKLLIQVLGRDKAIELGRAALFRTGQELGSQLKGRLGVGDSLTDLIKAARILYRVLGIDFAVQKTNDTIFLVVNRCQLADYYSSDTCWVLSATDEGVVQGLNPHISMKFNQRMAAGASCCLAPITSEEGII